MKSNLLNLGALYSIFARRKVNKMLVFRLVEVTEDVDTAEAGAALVDDYVRSNSMDTESVDHELIIQVIEYIVSEFKSPEFDQSAILVFLPGYEEISRMKSFIESHDLLGNQSEFRVFVLHSNVKSEDQKSVFAKCKERKLILSTNIAETSLTIDDVTFVIDPGKTKQVCLRRMFLISKNVKQNYRTFIRKSVYVSRRYRKE